MKHLINPFVCHCLAAIALAAITPLFSSCESDDPLDPFDVVQDGHSKESSSKSNISGSWAGKSGSGSFHTTVSISDNGGAISGTLKWSWGGVRKFSGTRTGNSVVWTNQADQKGVRDTWYMTLSPDGNRLTGHASKSDGGGYSISLSRQ